MRIRYLGLAVALLALTSGSAVAQGYPNRPIRVLVPFAAGGAVDTLARLVGQKLSESFGQPVIIENRPGAGGNLGSEVLAKSPPDGYTVLQTVNGIAISPSLYKVLPFDSQKDFIAVTQLVQSQLLLVANPKLEANNVAELIKLAKSKPGALNYGSTGVGNPLSLTMEMLKSVAGIEVQPVGLRHRRVLVAPREQQRRLGIVGAHDALAVLAVAGAGEAASPGAAVLADLVDGLHDERVLADALLDRWQFAGLHHLG